MRQERGRENVSFPGVEVLKPQGFKERSDPAMEEAVASDNAAGKGSGKRKFSRGGSIETARFQGAERPCNGRSGSFRH